MTKIIFKIHVIVLAIGFVVGFGFVPEVRTEFSDIVSNQYERNTEPEPIPNRNKPIPHPVAILPKTKTIKRHGRI